MLDVRGIKIAFLSYAYGDNGFPLPHPWSDNIISVPRVVSDAKRARRSGAQLVFVNFHWGTEYVHTPNELASLDDVEAAVRLLVAFAERLDALATLAS